MGYVQYCGMWCAVLRVCGRYGECGRHEWYVECSGAGRVYGRHCGCILMGTLYGGHSVWCLEPVSTSKTS